MRTQVHQPTQQKVSKAAKVPTSPRIKARGTNWPAASVWLRPENMVYPGVSPFPSIQAKLTIGQPGDRYEQEADRIADQVVREIGKGKLSPVKPERDEIPHRRSGSEVEPAGRNPVPTVKEVGIGSSTTGQNLETDRETGSHQGLATTVQRQCGECEEKEKEKNLQTKPPAAGITPLVQRQNEPGAREEEEPSGEASEAEETVQEKADSTFPIQRQGGEGEDTSEPEEQEEPASLQTKAEGPCARPASPSLTARLQATKGSGQHLSAHTRAQMEGAFGADLSGVRIHTDGAAVGMNRDLRAQAFTHGRDIYFGSGKFQPETTEGRRLLAHELVHVGQQGKASSFSIHSYSTISMLQLQSKNAAAAAQAAIDLKNQNDPCIWFDEWGSYERDHVPEQHTRRKRRDKLPLFFDKKEMKSKEKAIWKYVKQWRKGFTSEYYVLSAPYQPLIPQFLPIVE